MRVADELRAYEAAGSLAEELPYWGWLDDGCTCLTRAGELIAAGRIRPAVVDGRTPEQIDRVLGLWQRLLSGLGPDTRLQFHLLRRPTHAEDPETSGSDIASVSGRKRSAFLAGRVQRLDAFVVWTHNPGLRPVGGSSGSGPLSRLKRLRKRGGKMGATYLASEIESATDRFRAMIDAGRSLVAEHTPVELLGAHEASGLLSELTNKPGTYWDGATGSGMNWRLALSELEAERSHLRLDGEPVILYSLLSPPGQAHANLLELAPGETEPTLRLQPFALPPTTRTFQFLTGWVLRLLKLGGYEADGGDTSEIRARIEDLYALGPERRTLSVLAGSLPVAMWPALSRWTEGGAWGAFFDNAPSDGADIEFRDWQVIDLAGAAEHADLCEAALSYLLERMRLEIEDPTETSRLKLMVVDEAWRYMQDRAVLNYLAEAAKTWRKKNAALVLATQSAVDVTGTPGASALLESIPTKLFLANPELPAEAGALFRLNESEVARIRELTPKRELYLRRPSDAAVLRLEVDPESYWLYTSSPLDAEKRAEAVARHGLVRGLEALAGLTHPTPPTERT
ncbi:VirB4 family type IV secretion system protein [Candidatus Palauibacter sp.]|uniref:VirB4 family type IV secretion system protein n=1 Tax=Candidatus Palauibacter sp. TaxID=3101350 RepID=UPI003B5287E5